MTEIWLDASHVSSVKGFRGQEGATEGIREGKFGSHRAGLLTISFPLFEDRMSFAVWKTLPSLPFLHLSLPNSAVISLFQRRNHAGKVVVLMVFQDCLQVRCIQLEKSVAISRVLAFSKTVCQSSGQRKKEGFFSPLFGGGPLTPSSSTPPRARLV